MKENRGSEISLEEHVFKTLAHHRRRDVIRYIGDKGSTRFTDILKTVGFEDSSSLSYHLNELGPLLFQKNGAYSLSGAGKDVYSLMNKLTLSTRSTAVISSLRRELPITIVANSILWAAAILAVAQFLGDLGFTMYVFPVLWFLSTSILYQKTLRIKKERFY
ncbi:MAG: DUF7347 domain-containing protein [Candidatus Thorarchaeota archaeon]